MAVSTSPRFTQNFPAIVADLLYQIAVDVRSVHRQFRNLNTLMFHILLKLGRRFVLRSIRGSDCARDNQVTIKVSGDMLFVAVKPFALTLAAVPHLIVFDRHSAIFRYPLPNLAPTVGVFFEVLLLNLRDRVDVWPQLLFASNILFL
jgi:hypothetical protein